MSRTESASEPQAVNSRGRLTVPKLLALAEDGQKIVCLTAYSAPMARLLDPLVDIILVGDSLGMVLYGYDSTLAVTLPMMIEHGKAVVRSSSRAMVVVDLPFGSYQQSPAQAFASAAEVMAATGCTAVKLEGGVEMAETIEFLVARGIPVMAHIGMTPQSVNQLGGYGARGKLQAERDRIQGDLHAVKVSGAFAVVIENVMEEVVVEAIAKVEILTIGIGASAACDGQVLVTEDICGFASPFKPRFVKPYGDLGAEVTRAAGEFAREVRAGVFPDADHVTRGVMKK
ncbi:MAG: 3-methyl-2-oxobutanoate hydroxymethyltransferase [Candidatus Pacebacteria bacterium]|nr:3-methyl-2-oxobutanoate hydroxymethyltransferase [Candidatus Paceibacterota bacterium]